MTCWYRRSATTRPRRGTTFTVADQVHQLVTAREADPDRGFMARLMALCSLPRTNPGNQKEYKRVNGPYTLIMFSSSASKLPFGNLPRLLLAWLCTEAVRTQNRVLILGSSLGIVKLTGCRGFKPPHRVFRRGFTNDILGLSQFVMR